MHISYQYLYKYLDKIPFFQGGLLLYKLNNFIKINPSEKQQNSEGIWKWCVQLLSAQYENETSKTTKNQLVNYLNLLQSPLITHLSHLGFAEQISAFPSAQ